MKCRAFDTLNAAEAFASKHGGSVYEMKHLRDVPRAEEKAQSGVLCPQNFTVRT